MTKKSNRLKSTNGLSTTGKAEGIKPQPVSAQPVKVEPFKPAPVKVEPVKAEALKPEAVKPGPLSVAKPRVSLELVKPGAKTVCVAGSFNEWKPERTPLIAQGNGRFVGDLTITPGRHEYLFVVDGQWLPDPNAKESVQNPFGGRNSILTVSA